MHEDVKTPEEKSYKTMHSDMMRTQEKKNQDTRLQDLRTRIYTET